jgi:hypothetical protein
MMIVRSWKRCTVNGSDASNIAECQLPIETELFECAVKSAIENRQLAMPWVG